MNPPQVKEDQKVYSFINSEECLSFWDLVNFIKKNELPLRERWAFYLFGKIRLIDENAIDDSIPPYYGGYIYPELYHWSEFLLNEDNEKESILLRAKEEGKEIEDLQKLFLKKAWEYVEYRMEIDNERRGSYMLREHMETEIYYESDEGDEYCEACQESPCMCSDPEKTNVVL